MDATGGAKDSFGEGVFFALGVTMPVNTIPIAFTLALMFAISRVVKLYYGLKLDIAVSHLPGLRVPFQPTASLGAILPTTWWNPGLLFTWKWRNWLYQNFENETISVVSFITGIPALYTSNLEVARQVVGGGANSSFIKNEAVNKPFTPWGVNLSAAEGELWRKHRRILGAAFNNRLYEHVWNETLKAYRDMIACEGWSEDGWNNVPVAQALTFKVALLVLARCAFGFPFEWKESSKAPNSAMALPEALRNYADNSTLLIFFPWLFKLPFKSFKDATAAKQVLANFIKTSIADRKAAISESVEGVDQPKSDLFNLLVEANEKETGKFKLSDSGLVRSRPSMTIQNSTKYLPASMKQCRHFPSGYLLVREAKEDTTLIIPNPPGKEGSTIMPIPEGLEIMVDMTGLQHNPRYFDEPEKFKPSRWFGISNESEAFLGFSVDG
ncbi:hypothetical protein AMATHDRAFT_49320 [Amanita thiersii Skay4041]|uniref:Cytochrome P450 n=1 Tax=Amanita thiersii Skay4041 TaxID=703135 RepID=A0A2A9NDF9_9AGAR|nr:hypothetical protein AMATHDRAFT_49320 [Amanita thiersii Skay4041]